MRDVRERERERENQGWEGEQTTCVLKDEVIDDVTLAMGNFR